MTVDEIGRVIVPPEARVRHVRVVIPDNMFVEICLFSTEADLAKVLAPDGTILNTDVISQDSLSPLAPPDVTIPLTIIEGQSLTARTRQSNCDLSVIVEYP